MSTAEEDPGSVEQRRSATALVYVEDLESPSVAAEDAHHLASVRRVRDGELIVASDGRGGWRACRATAGSGGRAGPLSLEVDGPVLREPAPVPRITVGYSLAKGDRTEWAAAKLAELGVDRVVPLVCDRTVVRPEADRGQRRTDRLARIVRESAMQARLVWLPEVTAARPSREFLAGRSGELPIGVDVSERPAVALPGGGPPSLAHPVVLVGPEGGWSAQELAIVRGQELATVALGPNVLRIETAAIAAGALLTALRAGLVTQP